MKMLMAVVLTAAVCGAAVYVALAVREARAQQPRLVHEGTLAAVLPITAREGTLLQIAFQDGYCAMIGLRDMPASRSWTLGKWHKLVVRNGGFWPATRPEFWLVAADAPKTAEKGK